MVTLNYRIQTYNFLNLNVIYLNRTFYRSLHHAQCQRPDLLFTGTVIESEVLQLGIDLAGQSSLR